MSAAQKAKEAAIERELSTYLRLKCGHLTTKEVEVLYAVFGKVDCMCEVCGDWSPIVRKARRKVEDLPQSPLF